MFKLKELNYSFDSLEPHYDAKTVEIHHTKHHQAYVNNLNTAIEKHPEFFDWSIDKILTNLDKIPSDIKTAVINNAGGIYNHDLFWDQFSPKANEIKKESKIYEFIEKDFGNFENFKQEFENKAKTNFGSGWTWLVIDKNNKLSIINTSGHDCPLSNGTFPLFTIDIWEHTYYLKWQNRRNEWISAFWNILDWEFVNERLIEHLK